MVWPCDFTTVERVREDERSQLESARHQGYTASFARASEWVRLHRAGTTFLAAVTCEIEIPRGELMAVRKPAQKSQSQAAGKQTTSSATRLSRGPVDARGKRHRKPLPQERIDERLGEPRANRWGRRASRLAGAPGEANTGPSPAYHLRLVPNAHRLCGQEVSCWESARLLSVSRGTHEGQSRIWIDHRKAVNVSTSADLLTARTLESMVGPHSRYSGRAGSPTPEGPQDEGGEKKYEERYGQFLTGTTTRSSVNWGNPRLF